jgi:hypothetical protein
VDWDREDDGRKGSGSKKNKTQRKEHITMTSDNVTGLVKPSLFLELRANYLDAKGPFHAPYYAIESLLRRSCGED